jgi:sarcosine oxidase subunit gamma
LIRKEHVLAIEGSLLARPPFAGLAIPVENGRGVVATDCDGQGLATVIARKGCAEALASRVRALYGVVLADDPRRVCEGATAFVGTSPGAWLAIGRDEGNAFAARLREELDGLASVTDQSDGYAMLRLAGPSVRDVLAKGVSIDLHPEAFRPGDAAATAVAYMGLTLWRLEDENGHPVFEMVVFRGLAKSFWHWLSVSAAEFGLAVAVPD